MFLISTFGYLCPGTLSLIKRYLKHGPIAWVSVVVCVHYPLFILPDVVASSIYIGAYIFLSHTVSNVQL
jgi:hypothetical protein